MAFGVTSRTRSSARGSRPPGLIYVAGDVLIQQGTNHAWVNRGSEPCRIAFVPVDAMEP
jgi:hypothetical protein